MSNKRKAFNFFHSYYDVGKELNDKDRLQFYDAILKKQFENIDSDLSGMAKFAYISQKHSIDSQIKGYFDKTKDPVFDPCQGGAEGGAHAPTEAPTQQEKEKEQEEEKEKEKEQEKLTPTEISSPPVEITENDFVEKLNELGKSYQVNHITRFQRDTVNSIIQNKIYTKDEILKAWSNIKHDPFHKENNFNFITPTFLSDISKIERFVNYKQQKSEPKKGSYSIKLMDND